MQAGRISSVCIQLLYTTLYKLQHKAKLWWMCTHLNTRLPCSSFQDFWLLSKRVLRNFSLWHTFRFLHNVHNLHKYFSIVICIVIPSPVYLRLLYLNEIEGFTCTNWLNVIFRIMWMLYSWNSVHLHKPTFIFP